MGLLEDISRRMQPGWNPGMAEQPAPDDAGMNPLMMLAQRAGLLAAPAPATPAISGAVPLPAPRPASAPSQTSTDISASVRQPVEDSAPPPPVAAASAEPSMFGRLGGGLMNGLERNSNALLALGAGFAGAPNIGQAISRASAAVIPAHAADVKQQLDLQSRSYGTKALVDAGVPLQQAVAAAGDPELKKALIQNYIVDRKSELKQIGVDQYGQPRYGVFDPFSKKIEPVKTGFEGADNASTVDALVEAGVPKNLALAAQRSPDIMKSVTANYLSDRKGELKEIGVDRYGNKIMGIFDPFTKKITPVSAALENPSTVTAAAGAPSGPAGPVPAGTPTDVSSQARTPSPLNGPVTAENDITGPDYLERLKESDPAYARQVEQVINGDAAMPTGRQAMTPLGRKLRQDVLTVEPGASDSDFATRQATQKSYTSGNDAKVTKSINTTLHHAETLERAINELDNFSTLPGVLNPARSLIKGQYDPKYQRAKGDYETAVANFAKELDFAVSGGRPTVSGTKHQMEGFSLNAPKVEQMAKLQEGVDLLKGRLESHAEGYNKGRRTTRDPADFIDPVNRKFYQRVLGEGGATVGGEVAPPAAPISAPSVPPASASGKTSTGIPWSVN